MGNRYKLGGKTILPVMSQKVDNKIVSVPQQVFDKFLKELAVKKIPEEVITRLRKYLVNDGQISIEALEASLFSSDDENL